MAIGLGTTLAALWSRPERNGPAPTVDLRAPAHRLQGFDYTAVLPHDGRVSVRAARFDIGPLRVGRLALGLLTEARLHAARIRVRLPPAATAQDRRGTMGRGEGPAAAGATLAGTLTGHLLPLPALRRIAALTAAPVTVELAGGPAAEPLRIIAARLTVRLPQGRIRFDGPVELMCGGATAAAGRLRLAADAGCLVADDGVVLRRAGQVRRAARMVLGFDLRPVHRGGQGRLPDLGDSKEP